ncbi:hypothetical protein EVAR_26907_1 [Eumeta japonica]|uniref:Uncharacterized protein n=1 Tax=Eumeta variegata TaxID=151549 RepID=A0A4C1VVC4_EUMVA|nr:hypothetical protein EVAR_26907_1 [Eumeta japonica]
MRASRHRYARYENGNGKGKCGPLDSGHAQNQGAQQNFGGSDSRQACLQSGPPICACVWTWQGYSESNISQVLAASKVAPLDSAEH